MWIIRLLVMRSSAVFENQEDIVSELFLNRIGKIRKVFVFTENRDWDFLFLPEIWIRW